MNLEWSKAEIEYLVCNYFSQSKKEIAEALSRTPSAIHVKAHKLGLKKESKYIYDKHYFHTISSSEQAYWVGFICADGYVVSSNKNNELGIELSVADVTHLKKFNKCINGNVDVTYRNRHFETFAGKYVNKNYQTAIIRLYSKDLVTDLANYGITMNKSLTYKCPKNIPEEFMRDFIRGYFDGNGSVSSSYHNKVNKSYLKLSIETGSREFAHWLSTYLHDEGVRNDVYQDGMANAVKIQIASKCCRRFLNYIYKDSSIYLDRKYKKYLIAVHGENGNNHELSEGKIGRS